MESTNATYCRLCAELKSSDTLLSFQSDEEKLRKIIVKLSRLNILADFSNHEDNLPKMVCSSCIESLDEAFEFVVGVEKAQSFLSDIAQKYLNKEKCSSVSEDQRNEILYYKSDCSVHIKEEFDAQSSDDNSLTIEDCHTSNKMPHENKVNNRSQSSDVLPLKCLELTWNDYLWTCAHCETQFATTEELHVHSMQYHQCCNAYKCTDCNIRKFNLKPFIAHVKKHRKYLRSSCYKCYSEFMFSHQLHSHMKNSHGPKTKYVCMGCNSEFQSPDDLNEHSNTFYKDWKNKVRNIPISLKPVNNLTCVICKKAFKSKGTLNTHLLIHTDRKREYTCEKCGKCFLNKQNLAGHMLMHDNLRPYQCEICKCSFKTSAQLKSHISIHNGDKPHTCDQCGRGFRLQKHLNAHKIVHTDSHPYICSYCSKKFRFRSTLNQHLRQHTGVKPYSCDICKRDFTNWPNYNKHMKRRHGLDMSKRNALRKESILSTQLQEKLLDMIKQMKHLSVEIRFCKKK